MKSKLSLCAVKLILVLSSVQLSFAADTYECLVDKKILPDGRHRQPASVATPRSRNPASGRHHA